MALLALMLYGSSARGDSTSDSDIDLLGVQADGVIIRKEYGRTILSVYPLDMFTSMTKDGSLFVWHLVSEGVELFDCCGVFHEMRTSFALRPEYSKERNAAAELGWFLLCKDAPVDNLAAVKLMMYSIRTIALSRLAERRMPAFSKKSIAALFPDPDLEILWAEKYSKGLSCAAKTALTRYLGRNTEFRPYWANLSMRDALNDKDISPLALRRMLATLAASGVSVDYIPDAGLVPEWKGHQGG